MSIDLLSIPLHFIEDVHLVGGAYKHLGWISDGCRGCCRLVAHHHGANEGVANDIEGARLLSKR